MATFRIRGAREFVGAIGGLGLLVAMATSTFAVDPEIKFKSPRHLSTAIGPSSTMANSRPLDETIALMLAK